MTLTWIDILVIVALVVVVIRLYNWFTYEDVCWKQ